MRVTLDSTILDQAQTKASYFPRYLLVELGDSLILKGKLQSRHGNVSKAISDSSKSLKAARLEDDGMVSSVCCPEAAGVVSCARAQTRGLVQVEIVGFTQRRAGRRGFFSERLETMNSDLNGT